jgi:hypothetical protein
LHYVTKRSGKAPRVRRFGQTRAGMGEGRNTFTGRWFERARRAARYLQAHPRRRKALQLLLVLLVLAFCAWAVRNEWSKAWPLLRHAKLRYVALSFATVAAYYLVFILGWMRLLDAWGIRIPYRVALQAEMVSMLAKYLPGGVWTPAARAIALRRAADVTDTPTVLASILVEAALSAISGVIVFVVSLAWVREVDAPLPALIAFAVVLASLLHPRIFRPLTRKILKPFGAHTIEPLPFPTALGLLLFYCGTWVIGGFAVWFMLLALDASPRSGQSWPCSRCLPRPVWEHARRRCTACCSRSRQRGLHSA